MTIDEIKRELQFFFPNHLILDDDLKAELEKGDILTDKEDILPFLQTALFDEKVFEVELDGMPRVYFTRLKDSPPDAAEDEEDTVDVEGDVYQKGDYLTNLSQIVTLPLEPGLGNLHLRYSRSIVLRMFINTFAVEMATTFVDLAKIGDLPVLRLSFPALARKIHNAREFRAKVPDSLDFTVGIEIDEELPELDSVPVDISIRGMAFAVSKDEQKMFVQGAEHALKLYVNDELLAALKGSVKHLSRVRKKNGIEYVCGVEFDLETRPLAAAIESIVASVQRAHLKDLAEKSDASGIDLIS